MRFGSVLQDHGLDPDSCPKLYFWGTDPGSWDDAEMMMRFSVGFVESCRIFFLLGCLIIQKKGRVWKLIWRWDVAAEDGVRQLWSRCFWWIILGARYPGIPIGFGGCGWNFSCTLSGKCWFGRLQVFMDPTVIPKRVRKVSPEVDRKNTPAFLWVVFMIDHDFFC